MTWACPHEHNERCRRRNAPCEPAAKGCVIGAKIIEPSSAPEKETDAQKERMLRPKERPRTRDAIK